MFDAYDVDMYLPSWDSVELHETVHISDTLPSLYLEPIYDRDITEWEDLYERV